MAVYEHRTPLCFWSWKTLMKARKVWIEEFLGCRNLAGRVGLDYMSEPHSQNSYCPRSTDPAAICPWSRGHGFQEKTHLAPLQHENSQDAENVPGRQIGKATLITHKQSPQCQGWCSKTENAKSPLEGFCKTPRPAGPADLSFSQLNEGQSPCAILHLKIKASALLLWDTAL